MKYPFASPEWFAALHGMLFHAVRVGLVQSPDFRIAVCEIFYNAPRDRAGPSGVLAWSAVSDGPDIDFRMSERDDVTLKVRADFGFATIASRLNTEDPQQAAELARVSEEARRTGKVVHLRGEPSPPGQASLIHNLLAQITA